MQATISIKTTDETKQLLEARAAELGLTLSAYARDLIEEGLRQNREERGLDELRELLGKLQEQVQRLSDTSPRGHEPAALPHDLVQLPSQVAQLTKMLADSNHDSPTSTNAIATELRELKVVIATMMAALHGYRTGDPTTKPAEDFARLIFKHTRG